MENSARPWLKYYGNVPHTLDYPRTTLYETVAATARRREKATAYDFLGFTANYREFLEDIDRFADALYALGLREGDRVTIAMPTSPQGVICFYAVNKLGAVASMIHPLSTAAEIEFYINVSKSRFALTIDFFYGTFREAMKNTNLEILILTKIQDYFTPFKKVAFGLTKGRQIPKVPEDPKVRWWTDLMKQKNPPAAPSGMKADDMAVILYSGGTTGKPKGIMLSNYNFIAEGYQCINWADLVEEDSILAILPIFHGFGLGVCVNAAFMGGGKSILVPMFTPEEVAELVRKKRPSCMIGVPTLYEALNQNPRFQKTDLSCLKVCFSGADTLPRVVKERFEGIVNRQGGKVKLLEGYGLTEAVTGIMAMPMGEYREGSIGIPFPDMDAKIIRPGGLETADPGEEGELCLRGPAVMLGYLDQQEETDRTLVQHGDGLVWLHTGDLAVMDADGFFYFRQRQKRMIKSSGMNVYPSQVEEVLYKHPEVKAACVIGLPDKEQVERVKGFVVLKDDSLAGPLMEKELIGHCRKTLIKWSCPREIEFRTELPLTLVGKVAYKRLEEDEIARLKSAGEYTGNR